MNVLKRCVSGAVMIVIAGSALYFGGWPLAILAGIVSVLMMADVSFALHAGGYPVFRSILIADAVLLFPALYFFDFRGYLLIAGLTVPLITLLTVLKKEPDFKGVIGTFFAMIFPLLYSFMLLTLAFYDCQKGGFNGRNIIFEAALIACVSDAFAYFLGSMFGKKKFCPAVSPHKTVVGFFASLIGGGVAGAVLTLFQFGSMQHVMALWVPVGILCGAVGQLGDLLASMLKRHCGIKDFGRYIPGHGGMMDRMDSIGACLIVFVLFIYFFTELLV